MKIFVNTDRPQIHAQSWVIKELKKKGLYTENPNAEIIWNVDSIYNNQLRRGSKITIYWELDDYLDPGHNPQWYDVDLLYTVHEEYLNHYPKGTKILRVAFDPDFHKEYPVDKVCDYLFIGSIELLPAYHDRITILDKCLRSGQDVFLAYGTMENYPMLMSKGKVILDVLPKLNGRTCIHQRVYEAMATGCLMVDYNPMLDHIATKDVHYVTFDKFGKITDEEINRIKKASREHMIKNHTWGHRIDQVVADIYELLNNR